MTKDEHPSPDEGSKSNITGQGITIPAEGELRRFFELLRKEGEITIKDGENNFTVKISHARITDSARRFLAGGGPST